SELEEAKKNKFREREAADDAIGYPNLDEDKLLNTQCPQHLELRWQSELSSSIYASPLIADINSDGKLEVVVPSFVHYLEVLEGSDGDKLPGWPAFHQSTVHSSPLLHDIDKDGVREIVLATYNGEVLFFRVSGHIMSEKLVIPRLKVKKDWYVGLHPDPVDRSHPDVHDDLLTQEAQIHPSVQHSDTKTQQLNTSDSVSSTGSENVKDEGTAKPAKRRLLEDKDSEANGQAQFATVENDGGLEADAASSFELLRDSENLTDEYNYDYDDYVDESLWGDEEWTEAQHEKLEDYVQIDAHILCTPVIADIDNDGISEMVVAVSYFFDREYYDKSEHSKELGGIDISKYVAGGIVVFDLDTKQVKWATQLDLSTEDSKFRAFVYSSPSVVDLDGDGNLDILVGTSFGLFYVLDHKG
ncbi:hypothetical protein M569_03629, partial [Genlisea aurea]